MGRTPGSVALPVILALAIGASLAAEPAAGAPVATAGSSFEIVAILSSLHPDFADWIRAVRIVPIEEARVSQEGIYSGLVRSGGTDPRIPEDAPLAGRGVRNDVVLTPHALDRTRDEGWLRLILDHEYYHARHLARGWRTPLVDFGDPEANHAYYEAAAWGYVLNRALAGVYGPLRPSDIREAGATYRRHLDAIREVIARRQPSAWAHYRRFFPEAGERAD